MILFLSPAIPMKCITTQFLMRSTIVLLMVVNICDLLSFVASANPQYENQIRDLDKNPLSSTENNEALYIDNVRKRLINHHSNKSSKDKRKNIDWNDTIKPRQHKNTISSNVGYATERILNNASFET